LRTFSKIELRVKKLPQSPYIRQVSLDKFICILFSKFFFQKYKTNSGETTSWESLALRKE